MKKRDYDYMGHVQDKQPTAVVKHGPEDVDKSQQETQNVQSTVSGDGPRR